MVVQRVSRASVRVNEETIGVIGRGLLVFLAIERDDTTALAEAAASKIAELRCFPEEGESRKMNRSVLEIGGSILLVSQFTLAARLRRGRRPSFDDAASPEAARALCERVATGLRARGAGVETGRFGAMMEVDLVNDGPVTFWLQSEADGGFGP
jgi:D-tyrosyl-tRNA(Tyr) deacylase